MLANLSVHNIVLIDRVGIDFDAGLYVMTGETGAGKSILLDALALALGARGDARLVRAGADMGQVTAMFELMPHHPALALLSENGLDIDGPLILRRAQAADGKSRAFVNDQPVGVALLRRLGALLVEIHGQHDDRALVGGEEHRRLVDAFGALEPDAAEVAAAWRRCRDLDAEAARLSAAIDAAAREAEYLRAAADELEALAPEPGEEERLADRRQFLMRAEKVATDLVEALEIVGGNASPVPALTGLVRRLERKSAEAPGLFDAPLIALNQALDNLEEARAGFEAAVRETDFDPAELESSEERLFALRAAGRKHQVPVDDLPALAADYSTRLAALDLGRAELDALRRAGGEARASYRAAAARLSERRALAAEALVASVNAELPALKLEAAEFLIVRGVDPEALAENGFDTVAFHVRTNPGTEPGPMMKVASGGELARFMLALKVALADRGSAPTLVFDEIDTGVGGAVAEAIGRRLARLAERVQVLSVTHAPQVAAQADAHFVIAKKAVEKGKRVATDVRFVDGKARREEIARMLAGATISEEARAAADRLMAKA